MAHRKCTICGHDIVLIPSAAQRAKETGQTEKFYLDLFQQHGQCVVNKRSQQVLDLMRSKANG